MQEQNNSPEPEPREFVVTFTVVVGPGHGNNTAGNVEYAVDTALGSDDDGFPFYYRWSDITVTEKTKPEVSPES